MICHPCRHPHQAADCIDTVAGRTGTARHCFCQHRPQPPTAAGRLGPCPPRSGGDQLREGAPKA